MHLVEVPRAREPHVGEGAVPGAVRVVPGEFGLRLRVLVGGLGLCVACALAGLLIGLLGLLGVIFAGLGDLVVGCALLILIGRGSVLVAK